MAQHFREWMRSRYAHGAGKPRPGADCFTAFGAILSWNARREHWTVRRRGQLIGADKDLERAMTVARETAQRETPDGKR